MASSPLLNERPDSPPTPPFPEPHYATAMLFEAIYEGNLQVVWMCIRNGVSVNSRERFGRTTLHVAAKQGVRNIVRLLLQMDVNINAINDFGQTPLVEACINQHEGIVQLLIDHGKFFVVNYF